jgi:hypothetical protein
MTTSNVPHLREQPVADAKQKTDTAEPRRGALARAGESGDPAVQKLLAERETHVMNSQPDPSFAAQREAADKEIERIDKELARLGFTAE